MPTRQLPPSVVSAHPEEAESMPQVQAVDLERKTREGEMTLPITEDELTDALVSYTRYKLTDGTDAAFDKKLHDECRRLARLMLSAEQMEYVVNGVAQEERLTSENSWATSGLCMFCENDISAGLTHHAGCPYIVAKEVTHHLTAAEGVKP